jgi:hypothetical protein
MPCRHTRWGGGGRELHSLLTSTQSGSDGSVSRHGHFTSGETGTITHWLVAGRTTSWSRRLAERSLFFTFACNIFPLCSTDTHIRKISCPCRQSIRDSSVAQPRANCWYSTIINSIPSETRHKLSNYLLRYHIKFFSTETSAATSLELKKKSNNIIFSNSLCIHPAVVLRINIYLIRQTQLFV